MNFEKALESLKRGDRVLRDGWNGKGMHVEVQRPDECSKMDCPYLSITNAQGLRVPWAPSQADLFAEDWRLLGGGGASVTLRDESSASPGETIKVGPPSR